MVLATVAVLVLAWTLAGQLSAASASNTFSEEVSKNIDKPLNWIDRATGGQPTLYLGQRLTDYNGLWQMEFWNRSLDHVWSTDGSAPGPGPVVTPDLINARTGEITPVDVKYVVADPGIELIGNIEDEHVHYAGDADQVDPVQDHPAAAVAELDAWRLPRPLGGAGQRLLAVHDAGEQARVRGDQHLAARVGRQRPARQGEDPGRNARAGRRLAAGAGRGHRPLQLHDQPAGATSVPAAHAAAAVPRPRRESARVHSEGPRSTGVRHPELGAQVAYSFSPTETVPPGYRGCAAALRRPGR